MGYKMDTTGNWDYMKDSTSTKSGSSTSNTKVATTTEDTESALNDVADSETEEISYAEEASFTMNGDSNVRRGNSLNIGSGVANRWKGKWLILETTHTVDAKGYKVDGRVGRIPYVKESGNSSSSNGSGNSNESGTTNEKANSKNATKTDSSGSKWVMGANGSWTKVSK